MKDHYQKNNFTKSGVKGNIESIKKIMTKLLEDNLIAKTIPGKPKSSKQKYVISEMGLAFLQLLKNGKIE